MTRTLLSRAAALTAVALLMVGVASAEILAEATFEEGTDGFTFNKGADADASGDLQNADAAHNSNKGVLVDVRGSGSAPESVSVISPYYEMDSGKTYAYSFWGKSEPPARVQVSVKDENGAVVASNTVDLTNGWQRYMLSGFKPMETLKHYYSIRVGAATSTYHFDDFTLSDDPLASSSAEPQPTETATAPAPEEEAPPAEEQAAPTEEEAAPIEEQAATTEKEAGTTTTDTEDEAAKSSSSSISEGEEKEEEEDDNNGFEETIMTSTSGSSKGIKEEPEGKPLHTTDFEKGPNGWSVYIAEPQAEGISNLRYEKASHNGEYGAAVQVVTAGEAGWHAQMKSPNYDLKRGETYSLSLWVKASVPTEVQLDLLTAGTYQWASGAPLSVSDDWEQFVLDAEPISSGPHFFALNMGTTKGIFYYDDIVLSGPGDADDILAGPVAAPASSSISVDEGSSAGRLSTTIPDGLVEGNGQSTRPQVSKDATKFLYTDFESDADGFNVYVYTGDARAETSTNTIGTSLPEAAYSLKSKDAAHDGKNGVLIKTISPGSEPWYVQLKTPNLYYNTSGTFTLGFWAKSKDAPQILKVDLLDTADFSWVVGNEAALSTEWQEFSLGPITVAKEGVYVYTINVGAMADTYYFDDFTIYAEFTGSTTKCDDDDEDDGDNLVTVGGSDRSSCRSASTSEKVDVEIDTGSYNYTSGIYDNRMGKFELNITGPDGKPIGQLASLKLNLSQHDFIFGAAINHQAPVGMKEWYYATAKDYFNGIVNENLFKWPDYEPSKGQYQVQQDYMDNEYVEWAIDNGMQVVRGHALEWLHDGYGFDKHWSRQDGCTKYKQYLEDRIRRDVKHFKGRIDEYDVWNEMLHEKGMLDECDLWDTTFYDAFTWAHEEDPDAKLCVNDYEVIDHADLTDDYFDLIKKLQKAKVPLHCIGVQAHFDLSKKDLSVENTKKKLDKLSTLGLPIIVTEVSLRSTNLPAGSTERPELDLDEQEQAEELVKWIALFFSHYNVKGIYIWGFWDSMHWIKNGGIFRSDTTPKIAALAIQDLWTNRWSTKKSFKDVPLNNGGYSTNGFYGDYDYEFEWRKDTYKGTIRLVRDPKNRKGPVKATIKLDDKNKQK